MQNDKRRRPDTILEPALLEDLVEAFAERDVVLVLGALEELLQLVLAGPAQLLLLLRLLLHGGRSSSHLSATTYASRQGVAYRVTLHAQKYEESEVHRTNVNIRLLCKPWTFAEKMER